MVCVFHSDISLAHAMPSGQPERPERYEAAMAALRERFASRLSYRTCPSGSLSDAARVHDAAHIDRLVAAVPSRGFAQLDFDTFLSPRSVEAALHALGGARAALDAIFDGTLARGVLVHRPPGHHAERNRAMGFCLFNTVAFAATYALQEKGARVAIVDFDVHHGNGTQAIVETEPRIAFFSSHEMPLYPGTGSANETGVGNIHNFPLSGGSDGRQMREVYALIATELERFAPDILLFSAGFDAHADDPLASLRWREADYFWLTRRLMDATSKSTQGRSLSVLEGGYDLSALGASLCAHVCALLGERADRGSYDTAP